MRDNVLPEDECKDLLHLSPFGLNFSSLPRFSCASPFIYYHSKFEIVIFRLIDLVIFVDFLM